MSKARNAKGKLGSVAWRRAWWPVVRTLAVFVLIAGIWFWSIPQPFMRANVWDPFTQLVTGTVGLVFRIFGSDVAASGTSLTVNGTTLQIEFGCNGLEAHGLFIAAILAVPMPWLRKSRALLLGSFGIFVLNLIRVCGLFIVARLDRQMFEFSHMVVGQTLVIVATMAMLLWFCRERDAKTVGP